MNQYRQESIKQNQLAPLEKKISKNKESHFNPLQPGVSYLKPKGFLMFSWGIDKQHRVVMD